MTYSCPECGQEPTHRVWESWVLFEKGMAPKFIGCTRCSVMERV